MKRLLFIIAVLVTAAYVGCKQGDDQRCQVDDDCSSNKCNQATGLCTSGGSAGMTDAEVPDGPDAAPGDAPTDALVDAGVDA